MIKPIKKLLCSFFLLFLFLIPMVAAYQGPFPVNEPIQLYSTCIKEVNGERIYTNATQIIDVVHENGSIYISDLTMNQYETGRFVVNVTFTQTGNYNLNKVCTDDNNKTAVGSDSVRVTDINEEVERLGYFTLGVVILIGVVFVWLGYQYKSGVWHILGATWFLGSGAAVFQYMFNGLISLGFFFFVMISMFLLFEGYTQLKESRDSQKDADY